MPHLPIYILSAISFSTFVTKWCLFRKHRMLPLPLTNSEDIRWLPAWASATTILDPTFNSYCQPILFAIRSRSISILLRCFVAFTNLILFRFNISLLTRSTLFYSHILYRHKFCKLYFEPIHAHSIF